MIYEKCTYPIILTVFRFSKILNINKSNADSKVKFGDESEKNVKNFYDQEICLLPGPECG